MSIALNIGVPIPEVNRNSDAFLYQNADMSIGTRVKQARKEAGLTQKELAAKVGLAQPTLSDLETGESASTSTIASLANALGVSAFWLETGKGPKHATSRPTATGLDPSATLLAQLINAFSKCGPDWQIKVVDFAEMGARKSSQQE